MDEVVQLNRIYVYEASDKHFLLHCQFSREGFNFCESLACKLRKDVANKFGTLDSLALYFNYLTFSRELRKISFNILRKIITFGAISIRISRRVKNR